jgi:RNA polymerase sigma factor (sigma-70 family)
VNPPPASAPSPGIGEGADAEIELEVRQAYLDHAPAVRRHAYRTALGDYQLAEDATQEAFMEAVRDWPQFRELPPGEQRRRLSARARWRVIDRWHTISAEYPADIIPDQPGRQDGEDTVLGVLSAEGFWKEITTAVPPRAARAAYLRWNEEWTMTEIGRHLGVNRATVRRDLNYVLATARQPGGSTSIRPGNKGREA